MQQPKVNSYSQALVDAQFSLAGGTGVFCISEPVHTEWNKAASQNKPGKEGGVIRSCKCRLTEELREQSSTHPQKKRPAQERYVSKPAEKSTLDRTV